ncbi:hypothetical protein BDZ97DRAFT_1760763 [Flammula alnicola]|nr:hypothetical protein BDZ97DRAFT_1760763 [Flammula alnicola]
MIYLAILYLSSHFFLRNTQALSTTLALHTSLLVPEIYVDHLTVFSDRNVWNIIWSCLVTIFACTVHPNIPAAGDNEYRILGRRLAIMTYLLITPEFVILWAARQYCGASEIYERHKDKGWTKTHAFFAIMGGFMLCQDGTQLHTLDIESLEKLHQSGKVDWPSITKEEIQDKSKGDYFSKGVVLLQASWFIAQCIARGVKGLVVTELELVTLAFAALTGVIYFLWWNKPLDVRCPVQVQLKAGCSLEEDPLTERPSDECTSDEVSPANIDSRPLTENDPKATNLSTIPSPIKGRPIQSPHLSSSPDGSVEQNVSSSLLPIPPPIISTAQFLPATAKPDSDRCSQIPPPPPQGSDKKTNFSSPDDPTPVILTPLSQYHGPIVQAPSSRLERLRAYTRRQQQKHGPLAGLAYVVLIRPFSTFFSPFESMLQCTSLTETEHDTNPQRVPTFYSPNDKDLRSFSLAMGVAIVFGATHCIAWSFPFASDCERWMWRSAAIVITSFPGGISISSMGLVLIDKPEDNPQLWRRFGTAVFIWALMGLSSAYMLSRLALLVLPFISLVYERVFHEL